MNKLAALLAPLVLGLAISAPAAVSYASLGVAGNTNAFIFGSVTTSNGGHADGSIVVGGNWSGSRYEARKKGNDAKNAPMPGDPLPANLAVYIAGDANIKGDKGSNFLRTFGGDVYIGGKYSAQNVDTQKKGIVYAKGGFDLAPTEKNLLQLSSTLSKMDSAKLTINDPNNVKVDVTANKANGNLKVYTIDGSLLGGGKTLDFLKATGDETIVINVTGDNINWGWSVNVGDETNKGNKNPLQYEDILWNFVDAKTINIRDRQFSGTILAPNATVNQSQNIHGTLIAATWNVTQNSSLTSHTFVGKIPLVSAPEPAGVMTMGGFLALALFSRRRQAVRLS
ncbi:MAG: collagen-binding domain-containing protein [Verrucomicrobiota bacterium]